MTGPWCLGGETMVILLCPQGESTVGLIWHHGTLLGPWGGYRASVVGAWWTHDVSMVAHGDSMVGLLWAHGGTMVGPS